jgi:hypothetical protein
LQNCSNFDAGEFAGGAVSFCGESGVAPPVWGAAAPPCGVLGFDCVVVVGAAGVVLVAGVVDVSVVVVCVFAELSTCGALLSPGTVKAGAVVGSGSDAFWPLPPHAASHGSKAVRLSANATRRMDIGLPLDSRKPAATCRAVRHVLRCQLLQRATAQPQVLDRPGQPALAWCRREQLPDHGELLTGLTVDVDSSRLDLADDLAVALGAQAI